MNNLYKNTKGYPCASSLDEALDLAKSCSTKVILLSGADFNFAAGQISDIDDPDIAEGYWRDLDAEKRDFKTPGMMTYVSSADDFERLKRLGAQNMSVLSADSVRLETAGAGLNVSEAGVAELHERMRNAMAGFSHVFAGYMGIEPDNFVMRAWQIFAPKDVLGRTPYLHVDHSYMTGLWYAERATADVYEGEVPEAIWRALQPDEPSSQKKGRKGKRKVSKKDHQNDDLLQAFSRSVRPEDLLSMPTETLIMMKNLKDKDGARTFSDLSDRAVRRSVCFHKSGDVPALGQAGIIMVPQLIR